MTRLPFPLLALFALPALSAPLHAASSAWHRVEGGAIRLVTSDRPAKDGTMRGALEIRLNPGWKTYWKDPGSSGVPPTLEAQSNGQAVPAALHFPEPRWFEDDYAAWAGYDRPVTFAVTFAPQDINADAPLDTRIFLGLCETICIPVNATLSAQHADAEAEKLVAAAFDALPAPARHDMRAVISHVENDRLTVEADLPANVIVEDIFVAGTDKATVGAPIREKSSGKPAFTVPIRGKMKPGDRVEYTLVTTAGTVSGTMQIP